MLIRVPETGHGGHNPGESRRDSEVWGQEEEQEREGKKKKAGAPSVQAGTGGGSRGWNFKGEGSRGHLSAQKRALLWWVSERQPGRAVPSPRGTRAGPEGRRGLRGEQGILRGAAPASDGLIVPRVQIVLFSLWKGRGQDIGGAKREDLLSFFSPVPRSGPWLMQLADFGGQRLRSWWLNR